LATLREHIQLCFGGETGLAGVWLFTTVPYLDGLEAGGKTGSAGVLEAALTVPYPDGFDASGETGEAEVLEAMLVASVRVLVLLMVMTM
jgi:hypothetical protein